LSAPIDSEIDMSLSFQHDDDILATDIVHGSKAMPAVIAPSPMIATALRLVAGDPRRDRHGPAPPRLKWMNARVPNVS